MPRRKTLRDRIEDRIARKKGDAVFLPREFADLGGEDQVLRALRRLTEDGSLVRLGYGVYGRAVKSRLSGEPMLCSPNGFTGAARQALDKLGVAWEPTEAERAYNEGRSTQVPVNPVVRVKGRFRRQLRYGNAELVLER
jgi:ferredoxin-NADP reductase